MVAYTPPLADIRFVMNRLVGLDTLTTLPGYDSFNGELLDAILEEAAKLSSEVFAPLNEVGDKKGITFENGKVTMPAGFREAYLAHVAGGWNGLPMEESIGGQGLPWIVAMAVQEMWQSASVGFTLVTLLNQGATELLAAHGDEALKAKYLPRMISGDWCGTMNITEAQAGSDVGAIASKAVKNDDHYLVTGQKIFISFGDHDMADNIIHFVLARLPGAPEGTRGLSLFLVPKYFVNDDGSLGAENDVRVVSVEHKLGQHISPTCVMAFGDAGACKGWLVGQENGGIAAMFTMMNNARIGVGVQALGVMERARQLATDWARTRVQSRDIAKPKEPPVSIIRHADVRRMLMHLRASSEACRALAYVCASSIDVSKHASDPAVRAAAAARVDLLTPLVKAWITDTGIEATSTGVQVCGGMGYVEETGAAQYMRDTRVLAIYEGANGIHANDLAFRKLARDEGASFNALLAEIEAFLPALVGQSAPEMAILHKHLADSLVYLRAASVWMLRNAKSDVTAAAASSVPFLRLTGNTVCGYLLAKSAVLAAEDIAAGQGDASFLTAKIATARFFAEHVMTQNVGLAVTVTEGAAATMALAEDLF